MSAPATLVIANRPALRVERDAPMSLHTTWRIGGPADFLIKAATEADLVAAAAWAREQGLPLTVIGGGSNLLVGDRGVRGLVVLARTAGERAGALLTVEEREDGAILHVGAQAPINWVARLACARGWAGLDWAVGLPGAIGGATVNNAGAHGTEIKDVLEAVIVLNADGELEQWSKARLDPSYRRTRLKDARRPRPDVVVATVLRLRKADPAELVALADAHAAYRRQSQPTGRCAGSTFANPPGDFAGRLIEAVGLKGYAVGDVAFSRKHANFIVNAGQGTAAHVRELIAIARARVMDEAGIELTPEIEEIGDV